MAAPSAPAVLPGPVLDAAALRRLYRRARADRWGLTEQDLAASLERSVSHRFRDQSPSPFDVEHYLESVHVEDLALACACARGSEPAWEHFVAEFRSVLLRAAAQVAPHDAARELADSIYADLFGLEERDGVRRSLFDYFHGRSSLAGWLRAVLAQRMVDPAWQNRVAAAIHRHWRKKNAQKRAKLAKLNGSQSLASASRKRKHFFV